MNVIEQVRQHDAYHAEDATRECGDQCEFEPTIEPKAAMFTFAAPSVPDWKLCPLRIQSSLEAYKRGRPTGDFLRAVLENNLERAITKADEINIHALPHIVAYVREHLPAVAWGSKANVDRWLKLKTEQRTEQLAERIVAENRLPEPFLPGVRSDEPLWPHDGDDETEREG